MIQVLIVDDHPVICFALKSILEQDGVFSVSAAADGISAMSMIKENQPDLVVLDIALAIMDGMEILSRIKNLDDKIKVIILTGQNPEHYAERTLRAGADGFVSKDYDLTKIGHICQQVIDGYGCFPSFCLKKIAAQPTATESPALLEKLSDREMTVLRYLIEGKSNKEIGDCLLLSNKTISTYKARIFEKVNTSDLEILKNLMEPN